MPVSPLQTGRYRLVLSLAGCYLLLSLLLRLVLWWRFGNEAAVSIAALAPILLLGAGNDLVELLYLLLPLSLYLLLLPRRWHDTRWQRSLLTVGTFLSIFGLLYLALSEYFFFEEFDARFNLVAVDYLIYPHEVFGNIRDAYPVKTALVVCTALAALMLLPLWRTLWQSSPGPRFARRAWVAGVHGLALAAAIAAYNTDTLAWSNNRVANELTANGLSSFFQAARTNELDYPRLYRTDDSAKLFQTLTNELGNNGGQFTQLEQGSLTRHFPADPHGLGRLNVVVIVEESFGAEFVGAYGDERGLTPEFDALAKEGLLFTHTYATGTRTVRGLEAISTSFPPIPSESIVKRPGSEGIANWGTVMRAQGYHASFLYGGFGYFDNMNHFFANNGFAVSDRSDIDDAKFANIWGVSDEDLFRHAIAYYDRLHRQNRPFFSIVMSTSNHKPYTFPAGVPGVPTEGGGRKAGIRYADYAIGQFFRQARERSWYDDTVFVIVADHGARVYGREQIPLPSYRIPLLVIAPQHLAPRQIATLTSQIDIAPTVLGLLGLEYEAPFFGENVLALDDSQPRSLLFNHNHDVALLRDGELTVLGLQKQAEQYRYDRATEQLTPLPLDRQALDLATAYFQIAFEQFQSHHYQ